MKTLSKWQAFKITRSDVQAGNETAQSAQAVLGKIPQAILTKTLRAPFSPEIQDSTPNPNSSRKNNHHNSS